MEPKQQVEIQLGHMCNNRCVFCVSGQQTAFGRARPLPVDPILERISEAYASGHRKITLLGGEPTLQPGFKKVVSHAVDLGFEEIVIFTNGVKTAREAFIDEVLALGGNLTWRISIQGADKASHERTTKKPGSFDRIVRSMEALHKKGERITVNMCVVQSNFESVDRFPELLARFGVRQLHLDMVRPMDAGERSEDDYRAMIPRYSDMVEPLTRMAGGFADDFDLNIGNLPYCIAPHLATRIHHDGETTQTIAVDGDNDLSRPWDKYFVKRQDKGKVESCRRCVFDSRCNGIFDKYRELYGTEELVPITPEALRRADPKLELLAAHLTPVLAALAGWRPPAPFTETTARVVDDRSAAVTLASADGDVHVSLRPPGDGAGTFDLFSVHVDRTSASRQDTMRALRALWSKLRDLGHRVVHPLAEDALVGGCAPSIAARLRRLRAAAPFGHLEWRSVQSSTDGKRVDLELAGPDGERATLWLAERDGRSTGGYDVVGGRPSEAVVDGLRAMMRAINGKAAPRRAPVAAAG